MYCKDCMVDISKQWDFCPRCGSRVGKKDEFNLLDFSPRDDNSSESSNFSIEITSREGRPTINVKSKDNEIKEIKEIQTKKRDFSDVVEEPTAKINRIPGGLVIEIELKGVNSIDDIDIEKMQKSIEIKAYAKNKTYFKILEIPKDLGLAEKELNGGTLKLQFSY